MNREVTDVLDYCRSRTAVSVILPFALDPSEVAALLGSSNIIEIRQMAALERRESYWLDITRSARSRRREILFAGPCALIPSNFLFGILASGRLRVTCRDGARYEPVPILSLLLAALKNRILRRLRRLPERHFAVQATRSLSKYAWLRRLSRKLSRPDAIGNDERIYHRILSLSAGASYIAVRRRIVHVNAGLAAGGTERQIVLTLRGLKKAGFDDITFLGQHVFDVSGLDFHVPGLRETGIAVAQVSQNPERNSPESFAINPRTIAALGELPRLLMEDVHALTLEFLKRRPEIVHAWQDPSSIAAGLAGVIAGTPRIVLSCRNVNPSHFESHQAYMRPAWRALAALPQVQIIANSQTGAASYAAWLDLPADRIVVVRNGLDVHHFSRPSDEALKNFRRDLGIPDEAPVVCGVFRFWPEKRPALWIETAREIAAARPDARFILLGDGPLKPRAMALARRFGLEKRIIFLGDRQDVKTPMAASDVLLLTSLHEGLPNVLVEAQALGVAAVTTDAGGAREAIDAGKAGFVVDTDSPFALAQRAMDLIESVKIRAQVKESGHDAMAHHFDSKAMIKRTLSVYGYKH